MASRESTDADGCAMKMNYCGPHWMPNWMRWPLSIWFNDVCRIHDKRYRENTDDSGKPMSKLAADVEMLNGFIRVSDGRFIKEVAACMGFLAVRALNKFSWRGK